MAKEQKYNFEHFFESNLTMQCIASAEGYFLRVNDAFTYVLGWDKKDLLSKPFTDFIHPEDVESTMHEIKAIEQGQHTFNFINRYRCSNGKYKTFTWTSSFDSESQVLFASAIDISESRKAQDLLTETSSLSKLGGWELDLSDNKLTWSDETYKIHELPLTFTPTVEEAINFYHPDSIPVISAAIENAINKGESYDVELQLITANKRVIWVRAIGKVVIEKGKPILLKGTFQNIDLQKKSQIALEKSLQEKDMFTGELEALNFELEGFTSNLLKLHKVLTQDFKSRNDLITGLLENALNMFNLETGIVSFIQGEEYTIRNVASKGDTFKKGDVFELGNTYCSEVIKQNNTVVYEHVGAIEALAKHPCYVDAKLESYIGTPIIVNGQAFGTLNFSSTVIQNEGFNHLEREFAEILSRTIAEEIGQATYEDKIKEQEDLIYSTAFKLQEEDRREFAHDLHEGIAQVLTGTSFKLNLLEKDLPEKAKEAFKEIVDHLQEAVDQSKVIAARLMPNSLKDFGLIAAMKELNESYSAMYTHFSATCAFTIEKTPLEFEKEVALYRMLAFVFETAANDKKNSVIEAAITVAKNMFTLSLETPALQWDKLLSKTGINDFNILQKRLESLGFSLALKKSAKKQTLLVKTLMS